MDNPKRGDALRCVESRGPYPFVTWRVLEGADGHRFIWSSRHRRKGIVLRELAKAEAIGRLLVRSLWMPWELNWWIGTVFALGAMLFAAAGLLSLCPSVAAEYALTSTEVNGVYFAGSIPFTLAAYLQLFQSANAQPVTDGRGFKRERYILLGWKPHDIGWLSCALQFAGTILFNVNTFNAMGPARSWAMGDLMVWGPNFVGSVLFLASGYLAFIEVCHSHGGIRLRDVSWWVVFINFLGCAAFMASALLAVGLPGPPHPALVTASVMFTLLGAICFLIGSLLMLPETARSEAASAT